MDDDKLAIEKIQNIDMSKLNTLISKQLQFLHL